MSQWNKWKNGQEKRESGFESDDSWVKPCLDPGHQPPMHMVIPQGQRYRHICPGCGAETVLHSPHVTFAT